MQKIIKIAGSLLVFGALVLNTVAFTSAATSIAINNAGFELSPAFTGWNDGTNWTSDSSVKHTGSTAARVKGATDANSILSKSPISTVGYNNPSVSFWYHAGEGTGVDGSLESTDKVEAQYTTDGSTWTTFFTIDDSNDGDDNWQQAGPVAMPVGASNNSNFGIRFVANLNAASSDRVNIDDIEISGDQIQYKVLNTTVNGGGNIGSTPSGINCVGDCNESYTENTPVSLTATADVGFEFTGWSGDCSGTGACNVTMDSSKNVTANFSEISTTIESIDGNIHIFKYVDGVQATSDMTGSSAFPIYSATDQIWFNLDNDGYGLTPDPYKAIIQKPIGSNYSFNEELADATVGTTCGELKPNYTDQYKPYALVGYRIGATFEAAQAATLTTTSPSITVGGDTYVIVYNETCGELPPPPQDGADGIVHVFKYVDGEMATSDMTGSTAFPIYSPTEALWYNLDNDGHRPGDIPYEASTLTLEGGSNYKLNEELSMANTGAVCGELKPNYTDQYKEYALVGYQVGTSLPDALDAPMTTTSPDLTIDGDVYVIVHNKECSVVAPEPEEDTTAPTLEFLGFRHQTDGTYDSGPTINACAATNESGYIAWEWQLNGDPEPVSYTYTITSGPTAVGWSATTTNTYFNGGIPMEGTYEVEVVGTDSSGNESNPIECSVTYAKPLPPQICTEKTMNVISGTDDMTKDMSDNSIQAVVLNYIHPAWNTTLGTNWIWNVDGVNSPTTDETATFTKNFTIPGIPVSATLDVLADNEYTGSVNTFNTIGSTDGDNFSTPDTYIVPVENLLNGVNIVSFAVKNWGTENSTAQENPAGLNYKLNVIYNECEPGEEEPNNTAPTIVLNGSSTMTLEFGSTYNEPGAVANDLEDGNGLNVTNITGSVDTNTAGTYTITYNFSDSGSLAAAPVTRTVIVNPEPEPEQTQSITTSGGGGGGGGAVPLAFLGGGVTPPVPPQGRVLGATTDNTCGIYLNKFLRKGYKNDPEAVKLVQQFLNEYFDLNIPVTGFFGNLTDNAVKKFQIKFADEILKPWNLSGPTGIVYLTTTKKINSIMCPELNLQTPNLVPFGSNPESPRP